MKFFDAVSPFDARYYGADEVFYAKIHDYLSEEAGIKYYLKVEQALVETLADYAFCSKEIAAEVARGCAQVTTSEVYQEEARIQHNIRALVNSIRAKISEDAKPFVHLFATSNDIMDTAASLRFKDFTENVLLPDMSELLRLWGELARREAATLQMGRTHGQHAEPITFGYAVALYISRLGNRIQAVDAACRNLRGKFSGPVGAHNSLHLALGTRTLQFERDLLARLGLKPSETGMSSQVVHPEPLADLAFAAISTFGVLANFADDMRHLYRTEIGEVKEKFQPERVGSSTMPHKVNPKDFENVKSLWKAYAPRIVTVLMDQISEHQRDLTNSASQRYLTEMFGAVDYGIYRTTNVVRNMEVDRERMRKNLDMSKDSIIAEPLYIILGLHGCPDPYDWSKRLANANRQSGARITDLMRQEPALQPYLERFTAEERELLDHPEKYTGNSESGTLGTVDYWLKYVQGLKL